MSKASRYGTVNADVDEDDEVEVAVPVAPPLGAGVHDHRIDGAVAALLLLDGLGDLAGLLFEALDRGDGGLMRALSPLDARAGSGRAAPPWGRRRPGRCRRPRWLRRRTRTKGLRRWGRRVRGDVDGNGARGGADPHHRFWRENREDDTANRRGSKRGRGRSRTSPVVPLDHLAFPRGRTTAPARRRRPAVEGAPRLGRRGHGSRRVGRVCANTPPVRLDSTRVGNHYDAPRATPASQRTRPRGPFAR